MVVPAKALPGLPGRLVTSVGRLLLRIGVPPQAGWAELQAMQEVRFGPTRSRSVLGVMNEVVEQVWAEFDHGGPVVTLGDVDLRLSEVPWSPLWKTHHSPAQAARALLGG